MTVTVLLENMSPELEVPWAARELAVPAEMFDMVFHTATVYGHHHPFNFGSQDRGLIRLKDYGTDGLLLFCLVGSGEGSSPQCRCESNPDIKMRVVASTQREQSPDGDALLT